MTRKNRHAVVLGGSLAGLLAARVLSENHAHVTIVERDELPAAPAHRRGVPQGRHLHGLHPRGAQVLDELFPGWTDEVVAAGGVRGDVLGDCRWQLSGHEFARAPIGLAGLFAGRPLIEGQVRARVRALPGVSMLDGCAVAGIVTDPARSRVTGVRVRPATATEQSVSADLVVDATGRGSRTPTWLAELGYPEPHAERVEIDLGYATRTYRLAPGALRGDRMILTAATPANARAGVLAPLEGGRHILTVAGILGDHPPVDPAGFAAFAASLPTPDIAGALPGAEPLDDPVAFRMPASVRRRYERLDRFPAGLLPIGDAVCSFNPIYGQGMTVAALEALTLRRLLARGGAPSPRRWFRAVAKVVDVPWDVAVGADLAFPGVPGERSAKVRMVNGYLPRLHAAASVDPVLGAAFLRVLGMIDRPEGLLRPDRAVRVLLGGRRAARAIEAGRAAVPVG